MGKPTIRFKGYTDDWEQRKLDDLTEELSEYATMASGLPLLTSSRSGLMYQSDFRDRKTTTSDETLFSIVPKGSCTYRHMSDDDIFHMNINVLEKGLVSREYPVFISSENNDLEFIIQHINSSDRFRAFCKGQKKGGTRTRLYYKTLCEFEMMIPSIEEQKKISATLHSLDHLITLHQRKCDQAKILKKYMLQKMFPQNDEKVPKIRFKGFTDDWEQRKLGELASSFEYGLNAAAKEYDGENKYIRITDIDDNTHEFLTDNLTSPDIELTGADNYKLTEGDILFARTGASVGKSYIYKNSDGLVYYAGFLIRARIKEEYDAEFVFQNTLTDRYNKYIAVTSQRSGQPGVNAQEYAEFEIKVPQKEEQTKIGTYFHNIDHLITLHQHKCEELKNIKKFMLQNMFVQEK